MAEDLSYFSLKVEFDYDYSLGELRPYFDALLEGRALGSRCPQCERVNFPPRLSCNFDRQFAAWHELSGEGTIIQLTVGKEGVFAEIAMDGADNYCLGRLSGTNFCPGDRVVLNVSEEASIRHPAQIAIYRPIE